MSLILDMPFFEASLNIFTHMIDLWSLIKDSKSKLIVIIKMKHDECETISLSVYKNILQNVLASEDRQTCPG